MPQSNIREKTIYRGLRDCGHVFAFATKDDLNGPVRVWTRALNTYEPSEIKAAFEKYLRTAYNSPVPADIIKILEEMRNSA